MEGTGLSRCCQFSSLSVSLQGLEFACSWGLLLLEAVKVFSSASGTMPVRSAQ